MATWPLSRTCSARRSRRTSGAREIARLAEHFKQRQRLEALGIMAGGIAHDFNNVLQAVGVIAELAAEDGATLDNVREATQDIQDIIDRAVGLTRRLLVFSRQEAREYESVDVSDALDDAVSMVRRTVPEDRQLVLTCRSDLGAVRISRVDFEQMFVNLCNNAASAMPAGGTVRIEARRVSREDGDACEVRVSDEGEGIPPADLGRIFEPFFTTKPSGEGTGLGLTMARRVAEHAGGETQRCLSISWSATA